MIVPTFPRRSAMAALLSLSAAACVPSPDPHGASHPATVSTPAAETPVPHAAPQIIALNGVARQGGTMIGHAPKGTKSLLLNGQPLAMAHDGAFLIAFDRDAGPSATLVAVSGSGAETQRTIAVAPGQWDVQNVDASITGGVSGAEYQQRRGAEIARIAAARAKMRPASSDGWRQAFVWPVAARISGKFGSQRIYRGTPGSYHSGVDLAAPAGTTYVAPADGVVILAADAPFTLEGNLLLIDHGMGLNSAFLHSQKLLVKEGDVVRRGQPIGIVGATGRVTGPHLHWGMKWNDARLDPVGLVEIDSPAK